MSFHNFLRGKRARNDTAPPPVFDPAALGDPVAALTAWEPLRPGGEAYGTHWLHVVSPQRAEFRPAAYTRIFAGAFIAVGLALFLVFVVLGLGTDDSGFDESGMMAAALCLLFVVIGVALWIYYTTPVVFDRQVGAFWKGRRVPVGRGRTRRSTPLETIHAVQLLDELVNFKTIFVSYEINLVLEDGERLNVVDHGNESRIVADGEALAAFLGVPLWNAIGHAIVTE